MKTFLVIVIAGVIAAAAATWIRYESFSPCAWLEQDLAGRDGLPRLMMRARIRAQFLLEGVTDPDIGQCIVTWWKFRADGLPPPP